ncbi:hypothetical protein [Lacticaseibacillus sp. N501-2]|uniref:hypothetical protein n=1 Tax=Lacticaseibacillus salsurae TaxID=3367729 RepID=UPI0038B23E69
MDNKASSTVRAKKIVFIIQCLIVVITLLVGYHYTHSGVQVRKVVEGKIFEYQVKVSDKYRTIGYIAFGTDKENDGSLLYEKKTAVEEANKSGDLANQIYNASENYTLYWTTNPEESVLQWPRGLALHTALDDPFYPQLSVSVTKVSGIFRKTIIGKSAFTSFLDASGTNEVRLIEVGKVKE